MIKKILPLIFVLLLVAGSAWALNLAVIAALNSGGGEAGSSCPAYYADTNVLFSWDGNHDSGGNFGCNSSGTVYEGTNTSVTVSVDYSEDGTPSKGAFIDALNKSLLWTAAQTGIDDDAAQTVYARVYLTAPSANPTVIFEASDNSANGNAAVSTINSSTVLYNEWQVSGSAIDNTYDSTVAADWIIVGYSWDPANDRHSGYPGNPADQNAYNSAQWKTDTSEIATDMASDWTQFMIGEDVWDGFATDGSAYVDKIVVMSGFITNIPANW